MPNWISEEARELYNVAKSLEGKKALLEGGGALMQDYQIVRVRKVRIIKNRTLFGDTGDIGQATVFDGKKVFTPFLLSWKIMPLNAKGKKFPLGEYWDRLDGTIKNKTTGMVFDAATAKPIKWEKGMW